MIRYSLRCESGHEFDSWFPGSRAYDEQARRGLVECPLCRSTRVEKSIMAPALAKSGLAVPKAPAEAPSEPAAETPPTPPAVMDERLVALRGMIREMRAAIVKHTVDVGEKFPDEARKMHFGEIEHRPIRGEANADEARELIEDGVPILPVPALPDERN